jgi:hypothetical protein
LFVQLDDLCLDETFYYQIVDDAEVWVVSPPDA